MRPRRLAALAAALLVAACSLLVGPAPHLYRLNAARTFPPALPHVRAQLLIDTPLTPAGLDTRRIALSKSPVSIDYFADSEWTDRVSAIVQTALLESFENSQAITAIDREATALKADFILKTEIRHFEAVYTAPDGPPEVWVSLRARLVAMPEGTIVAQAAFEDRRRAAANEVPQIVAAFDAALDSTIERLVVWTVSNPSLSAPRR
jgi:cholesterol transport system auxiliary component